jgi:hypothetical protein
MKYEIHDYAMCCGLRGNYGEYHYPFPIIRDSKLSDIGGDPRRTNYHFILLNILIPSLILVRPDLKKSYKNKK